ncbi:MAG: oxygenase MpaB family protein [Alcanivorax sp.]|nr:oxygenase MpaB family protein [Alcanivorax sp.]
MSVSAQAISTVTEEPGTLGPDSCTWQDFGSWRFHLMLPQAFVMQVCHPVIDAGVGEHSVYRTDPWGRARRSTELLWPIVYARPEEAARKSRELRELHRQIKGIDKHGNKYFALDPQAYAWVHGTGFDATVRMHELFGKTPDRHQRDIMFREWRQFGLMLGIRDQDLPRTEQEYWQYFDNMIHERLEMGDVGRDLLREDHYLEIPKPPGSRMPDWLWRLVLQGAGRLMRMNLKGTLPAAFREKFGIRWTARDERRFRLWCRSYRVLHALTPRSWRYIPLARRAMNDARRHPEAYHRAGV